MNINQQIKELENQILLNELSNDLYYVSGRYKEDQKQLNALKQITSKQKSKNSS